MVTDLVRLAKNPGPPSTGDSSISGEPAAQDGSIEWTSASGKSFDQSDPPTGTTYMTVLANSFSFQMSMKRRRKLRHSLNYQLRLLMTDLNELLDIPESPD